MTEHTYDVLVLGGGTAGTRAARTAAEAGASTAMFNDGELGGLCILRGCMPTKTMLHAAHLAHEPAHHRTPGIGHAELGIDFAQVMANKDAKVARFARAKIAGIEAGGYEVIDARARFASDDTVEAGGQTYRFTKGAVIATGSVPSIPPIDGISSVPYWTSDDVMALTERPESAIVLGTGAIGLELAQFLSRMGTRVQLVSRRRIFVWVDPLISEEMEAALGDEPNLDLIQAAPIRVQHSGEGIEVTVSREGAEAALTAKHLVVATGRRADLENLGLEAAGVNVEGHSVVCGTDMRTSNPRVFVAGDATGTEQLLHVANWEGRVAGLGAAQVEGDHQVERRLDMQVVFSDPTLATIGQTEEEARAAGHDVITASANFAETGRAITQDVQHGAFKLVADRSGEILGSQILGPRADDLIHTIAAVMYYRGTAADLLEMPWYHPTLSEVVLSLAGELQAKR